MHPEIPSLFKISGFIPAINSPHTLCLGYVPASYSVTAISCRLKAIPRDKPARPPPIIVIDFIFL